MALLFWSSAASFDLNDLLTLGSSIPKASNKLESNPRSLSKKWSNRSSAIQWPTKNHSVIILRNIKEKTDVSVILLFYLEICSFVEFKGVWSFLYISDQFIFNKASETKLNNIFGFCFFLRILRSNLWVREHFLNLSLPPFAEENEWFFSMFRACKMAAFKICCFVVGLEHPVKDPALVLNVRCDLICFSLLTCIVVLECWLTSETPPNS